MEEGGGGGFLRLQMQQGYSVGACISLTLVSLVYTPPTISSK